MALVKIIVGCFIALSVLWYTFRFFGEHQQFVAYDHPLVKEDGPWVMAYGGDSKSYPSHSLVALEAAQRNPKLWLAVDVYMSAERSFYVIPQGFQVKDDKRPWVQWKDHELNRVDAGENFKSGEGTFPYRGVDMGFPKLDAVIKKFPKTKMLLWFRDNERDLDLIIASFLKKYQGLENRALIYSDYDVVMRSLKKQLPRWVYGSAAGDKTRFLMFEAFQLQSAANLNGDFYFAPLKQISVQTMSEAIKKEIERRYLPLILGPLLSEGDIQEAVKLAPKGFVTTDSSFLLKVISEAENKP
jgi:hypothetical protein